MSANGYDLEAVRARYLAERDRRLVPGRADVRDLARDEHFARYRDDPFTPLARRDPVSEEVDVVINDGVKRQNVPTGRVAYEPNSLDPAGPRESAERGFATYAEQESGDKQRIRPESFADHYTRPGSSFAR